MKPLKYIVFADLTTDCQKTGDNFIKEDLKLDFLGGEKESAICIKNGIAENHSVFNDSFDIFLFEDTNSKPKASSVFFSVFIPQFYLLREEIDLRIILHKGSNWNFFSFETGHKKFYHKFEKEIKWLQSLEEYKNWIYQSHTSSDVYCKEFKKIAKSIIEKKENDYSVAMRSLSDKFFNEQIEELYRPFKSINPFLQVTTLKKKSKKKLDEYISKKLNAN
ncbi:MAG: hypothetical protein H6581_05380 [Bacteroidia bacterium]|nr:hypothetical protein [Bacteroidia bacterium]